MNTASFFISITSRSPNGDPIDAESNPVPVTPKSNLEDKAKMMIVTESSWLAGADNSPLYYARCVLRDDGEHSVQDDGEAPNAFIAGAIYVPSGMAAIFIKRLQFLGGANSSSI